MRALFLLPVLLALAAPAVAQTGDPDFFPLEVGNRWLYLRTSQTSTPTGGGQTTPLGTLEWTVVGEAETSEGIVPLLRIGRATCGVRIDTTEAGYVRYALVPVEGAPCNQVGLYDFPSVGIYQFLLVPGGVQNATIGGVTYPGLPSASGMYDVPTGTGYSVLDTWWNAGGIGVLGFSTAHRTPTGGSSINAVLQYAVVGGQEYGTRPTAGESGPSDGAAMTAGPSPFRVQTTIRYALPDASAAHLDVVDALGRVVRRVDLGARPAGPGEAVLPAEGLAPGLYVARLVAGAWSATTRVAVVR